MWIIPSNLYQRFPSVQVSAASKGELSELLDRSEPLFMWKSKPLSSRIFWRLCNRVWWLRRLSGRILKPSLGNSFATEYFCSLAVIPASLSVRLASDKAPEILDTYGRLLNLVSTQLDLFAAISKTSQDTLPLDLQKSQTPFDEWVMQLKQESLQRRKLARHISGQGCLSSLFYSPQSRDYKGQSGFERPNDLNSQVNNWPTATSSMSTGAGSKGREGGLNLQSAVKMWPTPRASENDQGEENRRKSKEAGSSWLGQNRGATLTTEVKLWVTPTGRDYKDTPGMTAERKDGKSREGDHLPRQVFGQLDQDNSNMNGKNQEQLNPAWVAQLMGTTLEKIFFVPLGME